MTFPEYITACREARDAHPGWRIGQVAFNVLYQHRPDLSEQIRATSLDPFYAVDGIPFNFLCWVEDHWNEEKDSQTSA